MKFVSDPKISIKIQKMKERVRWQEPAIKKREIEQTRLVIADNNAENPEFSFLAIGDSGCGEHLGHNPQRQIAKMMREYGDRSNFIIHTGDIVYQVGSKEYYYENFIKPYREYLVNGDSAAKIAYDKMVFNLPFLTIPGNHDYYDLPIVYGILSQASWVVRHLLPTKIDFDVGWHGSFQGEAYAKAFLDYLLGFNNPQQLAHHLDTHYTAKLDGKRCLNYQPEIFTRLPNRYYTFRYGGIDFFALDSNTFNEPEPIPDTKFGNELRLELNSRCQKLERQRQEIFQKIDRLDRNLPEQAELIDDYRGKLNQNEEEQRDIQKRLQNQQIVTDWEQLTWLKDRLIESWHTDTVRGRVLYFHHPPYVTEATKWNQGQTLEIRERLRQVFQEVAKEIDLPESDRPIVDLVISGHAHCLEYLQTKNTGYADSNINWLICGGSGHSLRRQRQEGNFLTETQNDRTISIAESLKFIGLNGRGSHKRRPYSFFKIDVTDGIRPKFLVRPYIAERYQHKWYDYSLEPLVI
jgi:predicted phosphodiesterase